MERQSKKRKVTFDPTTTLPVTSTSVANHPNRFEAYKRCSIARNDALSNFITACLIHSHKVTSNHKINNLSLIGENRTGDNYTIGTSSRTTINEATSTGARNHERKLKMTGEDGIDKTNPESLENNNSTSINNRPNTNNSNDVYNNTTNNQIRYNPNPLDHDIKSISKLKLPDIVAPGAASKITCVVSTLSKIYAQRLIKSARAIATSQGYKEDEKILPHHLMEAHRVMTQCGGGDGMFFMQPTRKRIKGLSSHSLDRSGNLDGHCSGAINGIDRNLIQYQAAMEAQKQYDEIMMNRFSCQEVSMVEGGDHSSFSEENVDIDKNEV